MRRHYPPGRALIAVLLGLALGMVPIATANASESALPGPQPGPGPKTATFTIPIKAADGVSINEVIICISYTAPEPTYSGSNKTIHWGTGISCSEDGPFLMSFSGWLYTVQGSADHQTYVQEDSFLYRTGVYLRSHTEGKYLACLDSTTHRWIAKFTGTVDGNFPTPATWWSDVWTFPCS